MMFIQISIDLANKFDPAAEMNNEICLPSAQREN